MKRVAWSVLFAGSAALLVIVLVRTYDRLPRDVFHVRWGYAMAAIGLIAVANTASAFVWTYVLRGQGLNIATPTSVRILALSQLGKYIPGGVWQQVGWLEFARRAGIRRGAATVSILLHMTLMLAAALIAGPVLLAVNGTAGGFVWLLLLVPVVLVAVHPRVLDRAFALVGRVVRRPLELPSLTFARVLGGLAFSVPLFVAYGGGIVLAAESLNLAYGNKAALLSGAFAVAWAVGFLALPVPGGLAVREAVLMLILRGGGVPAAEATALAIASRLYFIAAEGAMAVVVLAIPRPETATLPPAEEADSPAG